MSTSDIGDFGRSFGRGLMIAVGFAAVIGLGRATAGPAPPLVLYLGGVAEQGDVGYRDFRAALNRRAHAASFRLEHALVNPGDPARQAPDVAKALERRPAVLLAPTAHSARAARASNAGVPIVFFSYLDPVRAGIALSLRSAGPGLSGVSLADELNAKRLEVLRDAVPRVRRVAVLLDRAWARSYDLGKALLGPAAELQLELQLFFAETAGELDEVFSVAQSRGVDAWYIPPTYIAYLAEKRIIEYLTQQRLPAVHSTVQEVARGALMAYEQDSSFVWDALADITLRILGGEDPASIPVQRPRRFVLAVRPRDEPRALRIDPAVVRRADRVY